MLDLSVPAVSLVLLAAAVAAVGCTALMVLTRQPRLALLVWLIVVCGVPVWAGVTVVVDWEPHVVASLVLVASLLLSGRGRVPDRITWADGLCALVLATALVGAVAGRSTVSDAFVLVVQWTGAFLAGRFIGHRVPLSWVHGATAVAATMVAALALVEFLTGWNPFVQIPGSGPLHEAWSPIQERGGRPRAEGAFGHSIALGASLALALPLTLAAPFRAAARLVMTAVLLTASAVTFSRIGLLTAVGGVALSVLLLRSELSARLRWTVVGGLAVMVAGVSSLLSRVFAAAGAEATDSASYRVKLLELVPSLRPFGLADSVHRSPDGSETFGPFSSIDNALLLLGLRYGWVPLGLIVLLLCIALWCVLSGRATAPTIAFVVQIPAFATVALITQYSTLLWFVAGLAVFSQSVRDRHTDRRAGAPTAGPDVPGAVRGGAGVAVHAASPGMVARAGRSPFLALR